MRLKRLNANFSKEIISELSKRRSHRSSICEGAISSLWQTWCYFCRKVVLHSAKGTLTINGELTTSPYIHLEERQLITLAIKFSRGERIPNVIPLANGWVDIAWGDLDKLNKVILGLEMSNQQQLLSSFGSQKHIGSLHKSRNACSHISEFTIQQLKNMRVYYDETFFMHPSDIMFWVEPVSGKYLWNVWLDEMDILSSLVIE